MLFATYNICWGCTSGNRFNDDRTASPMSNCGTLAGRRHAYRPCGTPKAPSSATAEHIAHPFQRHAEQRFIELRTLLRKPGVKVTIAGTEGKSSLGTGFAKEQWRDYHADGNRAWKLTTETLDRLSNELVKDFPGRVSFGQVNDKASAEHYMVWGANAGNWDLPTGASIPGGGQARAMGNQKEGVFGIVTTPLDGEPGDYCTRCHVPGVSFTYSGCYPPNPDGTAPYISQCLSNVLENIATLVGIGKTGAIALQECNERLSNDIAIFKQSNDRRLDDIGLVKSGGGSKIAVTLYGKSAFKNATVLQHGLVDGRPYHVVKLEMSDGYVLFVNIHAKHGPKHPIINPGPEVAASIPGSAAIIVAGDFNDEGKDAWKGFSIFGTITRTRGRPPPSCCDNTGKGLAGLAGTPNDYVMANVILEPNVVLKQKPNSQASDHLPVYAIIHVPSPSPSDLPSPSPSNLPSPSPSNLPSPSPSNLPSPSPSNLPSPSPSNLPSPSPSNLPSPSPSNLPSPSPSNLPSPSPSNLPSPSPSNLPSPSPSNLPSPSPSNLPSPFDPVKLMSRAGTKLSGITCEKLCKRIEKWIDIYAKSKNSVVKRNLQTLRVAGLSASFAVLALGTLTVFSNASQRQKSLRFPVQLLRRMIKYGYGTAGVTALLRALLRKCRKCQAPTRSGEKRSPQ